MSERSSHKRGDLDIELARHIDVICRRFEADWRAGHQPRVDDYEGELSEEARAALRAELIALERELRPADATIVRPGAGGATAAEPRMATSSAAEAPTIAPAPPPTVTMGGSAPLSVREETALLPRVEATVDLGSSVAGQPDTTAPNRIRYFGDYEIIRELARGGMGVVFEARQVSLNRKVALKMILAGQLADDDAVRRFYIEAEAAANLDHPGIVPIYEVGQHEGQHYFSMGFIEGQSLSQRLAEGPLPAREAAELVRRVCEAIEYAHQHGVIHRDLKPANILLDKGGNPRVTDFGLAKKVQADSGLTGSGQIMGTPSYMPPEQAGAKHGDVRPAADVYALGATLYALLAGRPPFQAATAMDTVLQVISEEPVSLRRLNASIPRDLETICLKCLEKEPGKRYASASALGEDLGRYLAGEPIMARPVTKVERAVKWARRRPAIAALLGLVALVMALGLGGVLWQWREAVAARAVAELEAGRAKTQTELAEQRLYDVRMNFVQHYWDDYDGKLFQQALIDQLPGNRSGIDRRGFEWFYWQRKLSSGHITLKGHTDTVASVAYSPDGNRLASASSDATVKLWDASTAREILTLRGHEGSVNCVAFNPDGKRLASAGHDRTVRLWDGKTGREFLTLKGHTDMVNSVAFSADGKRLASASSDTTVKVWDAATGREIQTLTGHPGRVNSVAFSPGGELIASAGWPDAIKVWDARTGQQSLAIERRSGGVNSVMFSPDGKRLAAASDDGIVRLWDTGTGQEHLTLTGHTGPARSVAFSPDGRRLASTSFDGTVRLWDAQSGQASLNLKAHTNIVGGVAFRPDGKRLASASSDQTVIVWDVEKGQETTTLRGHTAWVTSVAFSQDGKRLASTSFDGTVRLWDAETGRESATFKGHTGVVACVAFRPDGKRLASGSSKRIIKIWDIATGHDISTFNGHTSPVTSVAYSPDGKRLAAVIFGTLKLLDADTGRETLTIDGCDINVTLSQDGRRIASAAGQTARVWDAKTGQEVRALKVHTGWFWSVAFSPDGTRLAAASGAMNEPGEVTVWDVETGRQAFAFKGHTKQVLSVAYSPDGTRLASASEDRTVKVWDAVTGQETLTLKGHDDKVTCVTFSPDGKRIASASWDQTVKLWDARPLDSEPTNPGLLPR